MDSFIFSVNAVLPIVLMVAIGYLLKRICLLNEDGTKLLNKLVFRLFLPTMLFLNVYKIRSISGFNFAYILYAAAVTVLVFLIMIPVVIKATPKNERRGVLLQAAFRSNFALVGLPLAGSLFGESGESVAAMMSVVTIPLFNVLAVISLTVFNKDGERPDVKKILLGIWKNPLIRAILLGIACLLVREIFVFAKIDFRLSDLTPIMSTVEKLSGVATPLALVALGAGFEFTAIKELKREIIIGVMTKVVIVPSITLSLAVLLFKDVFGGAHFAAFTAFFATPIAVSSVPMAQEMKADSALAGQLVIFTTIVSAFTIFAAAFILKSIGIF